MLASFTTVKSKHRIGHSLMALGAVAFLLLSLVISTLPPAHVAAFGLGEIIDLSNQARTSNGVTALNVNEQLTAAAQAKAEHMLANRYFEHTAPDGTTGWFFIKNQDYSYKTAGENLAATNETASAVVNGWMNSPGHRANLLNPKFSDVGYGMVQYGDFEDFQDVYFVVALYAEPREQPTPVVATPSSPPSNTMPLDESVSPSGTVRIVEKSPPRVNSDLLLVLATVSACLLVVGSVLEVRHLLHNRSLFPHSPHHA